MIYLRSSILFTCVLAVACSDSASDDGAGEGSGTETNAASTGGTATAGVDTGIDSTAAGMDSSAGSEESTGGEPVGLACLNEQFVSGQSPGPDYTQFDVTIGSHCQGTNHQDITEVERVVFLGDSVTVGTPPTMAPDFYRSLVADELATLFDIEAPTEEWKQFDLIGGTAAIQESGDFASCAVWGARNDDLQSQLEDCFAPEDFEQRTLVVMTMGGNDVSRIAQDAIDGVPIGELFEDLEAMVEHHETAIDWLTGDPGMFPNGVFVVNANVYEYTDYTVDVLSCPAAGTVGFEANPKSPEVLLGSLNLINEEYMRIAEESQTDVVFMFEAFCGHGFHADDPNNVCYRGPDMENWFDFTCIHPTPAGHLALADMFVNVVAE